MTNVTGVLHILIGTYELLNLRNLSAQASRRGLDIHFPRYQWQEQADCQHFQSVLLALLKEVPLQADVANLMQHWSYFYERSIGCVGVLKDWLLRTVAAVLHEGNDALTLAHMQKYALSVAQCGRMALEAVEGEKQLEYDEQERSTLWSLLQAGMSNPQIPLSPEVNSGETSSVSGLASNDSISTFSPTSTKTSRQKRTSNLAKATSSSSDASTSPSTTRQKRTTKTKTATTNTISPAETDTQIEEKSAPKKKQQSKKTRKTVAAKNEIGTVAQTDSNLSGIKKEQIVPSSEEQPAVRKKTTPRVGQRKPKRDPVGD